MPETAISRLYCPSLTEYIRRKTVTVNIGDVPLGSDYPIRVQSMTTVDTMDTEGSVKEAIRMVESGSEYVRITAPSVKEAQNLENIKKGLALKGVHVPLIADIHFTPNAAELAARIVEKVRINPGNYADRKRFETIEYTDESYGQELDRIRLKFAPLVKICKEYGTAMRIGTNHGSLSDRILSRYGDTPSGMVESALEFLRICEDSGYYNITLSMKSSNPQVMVQAYRLLVLRLEEEGLRPYPLHLGVTEAGEAEDGRIKSALGIGTLLEDGLGDTVRVSLTEPPENEAPVAQRLIDRYNSRSGHSKIPEISVLPYDPFSYFRRETSTVYNFGADNVPRVIADFSTAPIISENLKSIGHFYMPLLDKWRMNDQGADFIYTGQHSAPFMLPNGLREILDAQVWEAQGDRTNKFPLFTLTEWYRADVKSEALNFVTADIHSLTAAEIQKLSVCTNLVLIIASGNLHAMPELRRVFISLSDLQARLPVVIRRSYEVGEGEDLSIDASVDAGGLFIDGFGDGLMLSPVLTTNISQNAKDKALANFNSVAFGILQAARTRMTKTEYISCPSCGRTLFDLQETTAIIRKHTEHLKGVKIGIMGCIVNGPGEMADADYGYVGMGKNKIALYRKQTVVKRSVSAELAVDELIALIKEDGRWVEPGAEQTLN